jgi:hypothetical protein
MKGHLFGSFVKNEGSGKFKMENSKMENGKSRNPEVILANTK